jgi:hypothetical protein
MMKTKYFLLFILLILYACDQNDKTAQAEQQIAAQRDSIYFSRVISHLRENFDDIHDVSMRYHHFDHTLNGMIVLRLKWQDGKMQAGEAIENETGNPEFARALIKKIKRWYIDDLSGYFEANLPLRIQIVGSDDSTFTRKGIFTGEVIDSAGEPVRRARIEFLAAENQTDTVNACSSNREGIFVRTLIPPGKWHVRCTAKGFRPVLTKDVHFDPGEHKKYVFNLENE